MLRVLVGHRCASVTQRYEARGVEVNIQVPGASAVWVAGVGEPCWYVYCHVGRGV